MSTCSAPAELVGDTLLVLMDENAQMIEGVMVEAIDLRSALGFGSFEDRRAQGLGLYVTREDITKRNTLRLSDVLRGQRGVYLVRARERLVRRALLVLPDRAATARRRSGSTVSAPAAWRSTTSPPTRWRRSNSTAVTATTPFQFTVADGAITQRCGTIVIWTRVPGTP